VTVVNVMRPEVTDLPFYTSSCRHSSVGGLFPDLGLKQAIAEAVIIPGGGKGFDPQAALLGGLGEIAERLLAVLHFSAIQDTLELTSYDALATSGRRALGPKDIPLFAAEQYEQVDFPYRPFEPETRLRWLAGSDLINGGTVFVPAQLVLLYYKYHPDEVRIGYPTTGGLAFHSDSTRAVLHGLLEVVERDAINVHWYARVPPRRVRVDLKSVGRASQARWPTRWMTGGIGEIEVYLNAADVPVPVFTTLAVDATRRKRSLLGGGGAGPSKVRALSQAVLELGQSRTSLKYYQAMGYKNITAASAVSEMTDFFDAAIFYGFDENRHRLDWYRGTDATIAWVDIRDDEAADGAHEYEATLAWMAAAGMSPIMFDFGGACWSGVSVTKVFIPQLTQACVPSHPYLGHPRFYQPWPALGARPLAFQDLNQDPVPFP
jgi:ribosomal protein S12 methylthiotransferase accessory factor